MARPSTGTVVVNRGKRGTTYAARFRAGGKRQYVTLGTSEEGFTVARAEEELQNLLADVRRGVWKPPEPPRETEEQSPEPTFHEFASAWVERRGHEVEERTAEHWRWALSCHLLLAFASWRPSEITVQRVDAFKAEKVRERHALDAARGRGEKVRERGLSHASINKVLKVLAQVLDDAVEYGYLDANPARGKKRRLKAAKPRRTWLELDEVRSLLDGASDSSRALLATMTLAGLRVSEATGLRWRAVDLAKGSLVVEESKTDAGEGRVVDLTPMLREELVLHRASSRYAATDDLVFPTRNGTRQHRANVGNRVLAGAIKAANAERTKVDRPPIQDGVTNHTLRRTFASLLYEADASPAYVMAQMGHTSAAMALEVYAKKMARSRDTGARMDALVRGVDWAVMGSSSDSDPEPVPNEATKNPAGAGLF